MREWVCAESVGPTCLCEVARDITQYVGLHLLVKQPHGRARQLLEKEFLLPSGKAPAPEAVGRAQVGLWGPV